MKVAATLFSLVLASAGLTGAAHAQSGEADMASIVMQWTESAHADATARAFNHWNDEGEVPARCAMCHAGSGFRDFYGIDGSAAGTIDNTVPIGGVIDCDTCHADGVSDIAEVTFPSGISVAALDNSATCMTCHQGRQSGAAIAERLAGLAEDMVDPEIRFMNPHYKAAAATLMGSRVAGLYEYPGQTYVGQFGHVPEFQACSTCHSPHSLEVRVDTCATCHADADTPRDIRLNRVDFDGDGTGLTGISVEVAALNARLGELVIRYGNEVAGAPVIWADGYPYFFNDTNANGAEDEGEAVYPNAYANWTPRMLKAAYNYQFVKKDPGSYAHNPRYVLQVLHDSIVDISAALGEDATDITRAE